MKPKVEILAFAFGGGALASVAIALQAWWPVPLAVVSWLVVICLFAIASSPLD